MSDVEFTTIDWDETVFKNTYETVWQIVLALVSHQKPLAIYRKIARQHKKHLQEPFCEQGDGVMG